MNLKILNILKQQLVERYLRIKSLVFWKLRDRGLE